MSIVISVCETVLQLARKKFVYDSGLRTNRNVPNLIVVAEKVLNIIEDIINTDRSIDIDSVVSLEYDYDGEIDIYTNCYENMDDNFGDDNCEIEHNAEALSQQVSQEWEEVIIENVKFTYKEMVNILSFYDKVKKNKLEQTKRRYSKVYYYSTIARIREYVKNKNTVANKFNDVERFVVDRFNSARTSMFHVSEQDLQRWAMIKAREIKLKFKASRNWLHSFKVRNRIVARKITKYATMKEVDNQTITEDDACNLYIK